MTATISNHLTRLVLVLMFVTTGPTAQVISLNNYSFAPMAGIAGQPLDIQLMASQNPFSCASGYPLKEALVEDNKITLRYIHEVSPLIDCIQIYDPLMQFGPNFKVPALEAGEYEVYQNETYTCLQSNPACMIPELYEKIGTLTLTDRDDYSANMWYFETTEPEPDTDFELQLLNPGKGNCNDYFTNNESLQQNGYISLTFVSRYQDPELICIVDLHPNGPVFELEGMSEGNYNVFITELPPCAACLPGQEICMICDVYVAPMYLGQISVGGGGDPTPVKKESRIENFKVRVASSPGGVTLTGLPAEITGESVSLVNSKGKSIPVQVSTLDNSGLQVNFKKAPPVGVYHVVFGNKNNTSRVLSLPINVSD